MNYPNHTRMHKTHFLIFIYGKKEVSPARMYTDKTDTVKLIHTDKINKMYTSLNLIKK